MEVTIPYLRKFMRKLSFKNDPPEYLDEYPSFLSRERALWTGLYRKKLMGEKGVFGVSGNREYDRVSGLKNEQYLIRSIIEDLEEEDIFWDVGCNIGTHSVFAGLKTNCKILGFEPYSKNYSSCVKNFSLNNLNGKVLRVALYDEKSKKYLTRETEEFGEGRVYISEKGSVEIETITGDKLVSERNLEPPNIVKIDVEGAEMRVLEGMEKTIEEENLRTIYIELHPNKLERYGDSEEKLNRFLKEKGFRRSEIGSRGDETHIKALSH